MTSKPELQKALHASTRDRQLILLLLTGDLTGDTAVALELND